jgi:tetratricopeptide (TPR) repeat protein
VSSAPQAHGTKEQAMANARQLLAHDPSSAERQARIIIEGDKNCVDAFSILGMSLRRQGRIEEAKATEQEAIDLSMLNPPLFEAVMSLGQQQLENTERLAQQFLTEHPENAAAMRLLAEVAARMGRFDTAERLLDDALSIAPDYCRAKSLQSTIRRLREAYAVTNSGPRRNRIEWPDANSEQPLEEGLQLYEKVVQQFPNSPANWVSYGHVFRTVGLQDDAVAKYRRAIEARPTFGEAWSAIADLKSSRLTKDDIERLKHLVRMPNVDELDRAQMYFALGRALEQFGDHESSFGAYAEGNRLRSRSAKHDASAVTRHVDKSIGLFDREYLAKTVLGGEPSPDPIFVLGLPRAGSTLVEQILSSHPMIEATGELSDIPSLANMLAGGKSAGFEDSPYLDELSKLPQGELQRLGRAYLWNAGLRRRTGRPLFVDKMPNNWLHIGFILSILPKAKIIDARRHPLACGLSNFRQYFASGQEFTYDMNDLGRFYVDYIRMMSHFEAVVPGRIFRVIYEDVVEQPEAEIRNILDHVGVDFDERCLRFHENKREVRTASSEQVRRPIYRESLEEWKHFEPWLGPLKQILGRIAEDYPRAPAS